MVETSSETGRPEAAGMNDRRLAKELGDFRQQQASGTLPGGQLIARRGGQVVVDETVGITRGLRPGDATPSLWNCRRCAVD